MNEAEVEHRLLTVFAAEAADFDRLVSGDAENARARLDAAMAALAQRIAAHDGQVTAMAGGTLIAAFDSPVEAVRCAIATQRAMAEDDVEPGSRLAFRLGVAHGRRGGDAARVESLADAGGICLSGAVREQILGKVDLDAEGLPAADLGERTLDGSSGPQRLWRIAPPTPGHVPAIPIPAAPPAEPASDAEERHFPFLRLSLVVAALVVAASAYLIFQRTSPGPGETQAIPVAPPPPAASGRVVGPTLPGRPFVPEQMPFADATDRARLRAEYLPAAPFKALALSRGNGSVWYAHGQNSADAAGEAALDSCRRNAPEPCELYARGGDLVWERPLPPLPPTPWLTPESERLPTPFDAARVPLAGPAMRQLLQVDYAPRQPFKAVALARSGTVGFVTRRGTEEDAVRAALEYCGDMTGTACAVVAVDDAFVVPVPETMRVTGLFHPEPGPPFAPLEYKRLAEQYLPRGGWKAVALGADGRMGLGVGRAGEQEAVDAALADCRAAKPPSAGPGGVAAAVLGNTAPECAVMAIGAFTVQAK